MEVSRFCGVKSSISQSGALGNYSYKRSPDYGQWITRQVDMSFDPMPKRKGVGARVWRQNAHALTIRRMPLKLESSDYTRAITKEGLELKVAVMEAMEQPDAELVDYE